MLAQRLRQRVTFEAPTQVQNTTTGAVTRTWLAIYSDVPAGVVAISGREFIAAGTGQAETTVRVTVRYLLGISSDLRMVYDGDTYAIQGVLPDPRDARWLTLIATKGVRTDGS